MERLQDNYYVKSRLKDGHYESETNTEKQVPHMKPTRADDKRYFEDDVNAQELFNKYAGTGKIERDSKGVGKNIEVIYLDCHVGI
ncbi:MAG: polymorphic toxin type 50 domain-containing protein [Anaerovorax sp.]